MAPTPPALAPAAGLVNVANVVQGDEVSESLDALVDLVAVLRDNLLPLDAHARGFCVCSRRRGMAQPTGWFNPLLAAVPEVYALREGLLPGTAFVLTEEEYRYVRRSLHL